MPVTTHHPVIRPVWALFGISAALCWLALGLSLDERMERQREIVSVAPAPVAAPPRTLITSSSSHRAARPKAQVTRSGRADQTTIVAEGPSAASAAGNQFPEFDGIQSGLSASDFHDFVREIGPRQYEVHRGFVRAFLESGGTLFDAVTLEPTTSREASGVRISGAGSAMFLDRFGIRDGDILSSVRGRPVRSVHDLSDAYRSEQSAATTTLSVVRGDQVVLLEYILR